MHLFLIGLNHTTAPIDVRERLSFDDSAVGETLEELLTGAELYETVLLSTCNRTEFYGTALSVHSQKRMIRALAKAADMSEEQLLPYLYQHRNGDAVTHLYRVAAGLDSLVMGEPQILGQVREAYEIARSHQTTGSRLSKLFQTAVEVGKNIRSTTALGATPVSIATISLQLARRLLGELNEHHVLIVGAGEMCETAAMLASERQPQSLRIINRTYERAKKLADMAMATAVPWQNLEQSLAESDLVITGTGALNPIIDQAMLDRVIGKRDGKRLVIVDMGVPRDVETGPECQEEVFLYNVDALKEIADEHLKQRLAEVPQAEEIVGKAQEKYLDWLDTLSVVPTIVDLRQRFEAIRKAEVKQHLSKIPDLDERGEHRVEQMTQAIMNKILHDPLVRLKRRAKDDTGGVLADSLRYLFALDENKESS